MWYNKYMAAGLILLGGFLWVVSTFSVELCFTLLFLSLYIFIELALRWKISKTTIQHATVLLPIVAGVFYTTISLLSSAIREMF